MIFQRAKSRLYYLGFSSAIIHHLEKMLLCYDAFSNVATSSVYIGLHSALLASTSAGKLMCVLRVCLGFFFPFANLVPPHSLPAPSTLVLMRLCGNEQTLREWANTALLLTVCIHALCLSAVSLRGRFQLLGLLSSNHGSRCPCTPFPFWNAFWGFSCRNLGLHSWGCKHHDP